MASGISERGRGKEKKRKRKSKDGKINKERRRMIEFL